MRCIRVVFLLSLLSSASAFAAATPVDGPAIAGIPLEFIIFAAILLGIALFQNKTFNVAVGGLAILVLYKLTFTGFKTGPGLEGLFAHLGNEWVMLGNLFFLLMGFALLSRHFEDSNAPLIL